jgi:hypothetical protein
MDVLEAVDGGHRPKVTVILFIVVNLTTLSVVQTI